MDAIDAAWLSLLCYIDEEASGWCTTTSSASVNIWAFITNVFWSSSFLWWCWCCLCSFDPLLPNMSSCYCRSISPHWWCHCSVAINLSAIGTGTVCLLLESISASPSIFYLTNLFQSSFHFSQLSTPLQKSRSSCLDRVIILVYCIFARNTDMYSNPYFTWLSKHEMTAYPLDFASRIMFHCGQNKHETNGPFTSNKSIGGLSANSNWILVFLRGSVAKCTLTCIAADYKVVLLGSFHQTTFIPLRNDPEQSWLDYEHEKYLMRWHVLQGIPESRKKVW